jgi:hypothetical protein
VRKFLTVLGLWLGLTAGVYAADTYTLADGSTLSGDIVKSDDHDAMVHTSGDTYTNIAWPQFSQDSLKQLSSNPKYAAWVSPFIAPPPANHNSQANIAVHQERLKSPAELQSSLFGGLFHSSLGLFILLLVYAANLYAAFEISIVRGKPMGAVMGLSAILPIVGPIIFVAQPLKAPEEAPVEEMPPDGGPPVTPGASGGAGQGQGTDDIQIVSASWQGSQEEKKPQPQIFARGKFTLNKRFIETKFAGFIGELKGDGKNFNMELKTLKSTIAVECIKQVGQADAIVETPTGQMTVPFSDIQEIKLIPKPTPPPPTA